MDHHHIAYCLLVYCNILPYCNIWLDIVKQRFMGTSCTQLHMFYVAHKSRESETSAYSNLYAFVCHFIFQSAKNNTISSTNLHEVTILYIMTSCYLSLAYCSIAIYCNISIYCFTPRTDAPIPILVSVSMLFWRYWFVSVRLQMPNTKWYFIMTSLIVFLTWQM